MVGGTPKRMEKLAKFLMTEIKHKLPVGTQLTDLSASAERYSMYKAGPILCVNHGMGNPSISILLHELIKLMYHAKCKDPVFIRMGTCGGLGIPGGSVVISEGVLNDKLNAEHEFVSVDTNFLSWGLSSRRNRVQCALNLVYHFNI